jgi:DUF1365 family protein
MNYQPLIGFGSVRHTRTRPAVHRFAYRSFFLRLPVRALTPEADWGLRWLAHNRAAPFSVRDADHGARAPHRAGSADSSDIERNSPLAWIERVLADGGVHDAAGEIWLHTMPRVLGYVFNPVSFWLCHRADGALRAIVCEVNNTFAESHCYLLAHADGRPLAWGEELQAAKAFHVSPFCAVKGHYRFRFMMTGEPGSEGDQAPSSAGGRFIARIDYYEDAQATTPLLATSVEGRLQPATDQALAHAFFAYPLFTFGVVARIHWHALRLWLKRVPFFSKPAPPPLAVTPSVPDPR